MLRVDPSSNTIPFDQKTVLRVTVILAVVLAISAGYYQSRFVIWRTNHLNVLDKFGVQSSQELLQGNWERK